MESLRERLLGPSPSDRHARWAWWGTLLVMALGGLVRMIRLGHPHQLVFDETYYVKQAHSLMRYGYERSVREGLDEPDRLFTAGTPDVWGPDPDMVVHPPVGKWMIGAGEWLFGFDSSFGWRFASALVGTLSILLIGRIAWHLWHHAVLSVAAATLMAVDGHHFVQSRIGLLDIFVMFWALLAFYFLLKDREQARSRLALAHAGSTLRERWRIRWGPGLGLRWWRLAAGLALGLGMGTKWSVGFYLAVFGLMTVLWDLGARRASGIRGPWRTTLVRDAVPGFLLIVPTALLTYLASWAGWFLTDGGWKRQWAQDHPVTGLASLVPDSLRSLWSYHQEVLSFHIGLHNEHAWSSNPWSWVVQWRPTLFYSEWPTRGQGGCDASECVSYIASLGNLFVWWGAAAGMVVVLFLWLLGRDWRAGAVLTGIVAGWLPWFLYQTRTIYSFYAIAFEPWLVLVVVCVLGLVLGPAGAAPLRRRWGLALVTAYVVAAVAFFVFYYPVYTAEVIPKPQWHWRMWFDFWT